MFIVDSHCHLNFDSLENQIPDILARANSANVQLMQTICTKMSEFESIKSIAEKNENIYCSVGVHPNEVSNEGIVDASLLKKLSMHKKVIGIGETGLDYYYDDSKKEVQMKSFLNHIEVSRETSIPIIIHNRNSDVDMISCLNNQMHKGHFTGVLHCFSSSQELAYAALDLGIYISISGIITFKNADNLRNIVKKLPLEKILVETDSPFLAPVPMRGKTNEPAFTKYVVEHLALLFNKTTEEIARITTDNFFTLFNKVKMQK